jgi:hypothetical protein
VSFVRNAIAAPPAAKTKGPARARRIEQTDDALPVSTSFPQADASRFRRINSTIKQDPSRRRNHSGSIDAIWQSAVQHCQSLPREANSAHTLLTPQRRETIVKFRVELVWTDSDERAASSIFLTGDGRVILQGRAVSPQERQALALPTDGDMISVDRSLIRAIKDML